MKFVLITEDKEVKRAIKGAFQPEDELLVLNDWQEGLEAAAGADMLFVDMLATLEEPHKVEGYERFAKAKMAHKGAKKVPLVLIGLPAGYEMDSFVGWPDFVFAHLRRPVSTKMFRRASTWV